MMTPIQQYFHRLRHQRTNYPSPHTSFSVDTPHHHLQDAELNGNSDKTKNAGFFPQTQIKVDETMTLQQQEKLHVQDAEMVAPLNLIPNLATAASNGSSVQSESPSPAAAQVSAPDDRMGEFVEDLVTNEAATAPTNSPPSNSSPPNPSIDPQVLAEQKTRALLFLKQGNEELVQGELKVAIAHYEQALQSYPDLAEAHQGIADALTQTGDLERAAQHYRQAIELTPLPMEASEPISQTEQVATESTVNSTKDEHENGKDTGEAAANPMPWYERAAYYLQQVQILSNREDWQGAIAFCEKAAALMGPRSATLYRLWGRALQAENRLDEAEKTYEKSLVLQPELAEIHARMGSLLVDQLRLSEAVEFYQQAIQLDPKFAGAYLQLGEVWQQLGDHHRAAECWYQAMQLQPAWATAQEHLRLGNTLVEQGRLEPALWCYEQAIAFDPNSPDPYYLRAEVFAQQQQWETALKDYDRAIERSAKNPRFYAGRGRALARLERWNEAIAAFQLITELQPSYEQLQDALVRLESCQKAMVAESYFKMGQSLSKRQQWHEAIAAYRQSLERNPQVARTYIGLGKTLEATGQGEGALECYGQAIALEPQVPQHRNALADVLLKLGRFEEAANCYRAILSPKSAPLPLLAELSLPAALKTAPPELPASPPVAQPILAVF